MQDYKNLKVWQKSHHLVLAIYKATAKFPKEELYGLTSQIRRAAASIPANMAEGCARGGDPEFARFLHIAQASASELDYHLLLARDLNYLNKTDYERIANDLTEIRRMLTTFIQKLKSNI
jgi:four helix bundle protein